MYLKISAYAYVVVIEMSIMMKNALLNEAIDNRQIGSLKNKRACIAIHFINDNN